MEEDTEHVARARLALAQHLLDACLCFPRLISFLGLLPGTVANTALFQLYVITNSPALFYGQTFSQWEMSF